MTRWKKSLLWVCFISQTALFSGSWTPPIDVYNSTLSTNPVTGVDNAGNSVIAYFIDNMGTRFTGASQLVNAVPVNPVAYPIEITSSANITLNIAVEPAGNATLLWTEQNTMNSAAYLRSATLTNNTWTMATAITNPLAFAVSTNAPPGLTIDNSDQSIGAWIASDLMSGETTVHYQLRQSGAWMSNQLLFTPTPSTDFIPTAFISGSPTGEAFAIWPDAGPYVLQGAYYDGSSWSVNSSISTDLLQSCFIPLSVSMNSSNDALIIWPDFSQGGVSALVFSGGSYSLRQRVYSPPVGTTLDNLAGAFDDEGDGIAVWTILEGSPTIYSLYASSYINGSWQTPVLIDTVVGNSAGIFNPNVKVDKYGDALIAWQRTNDDLTTAIYVARLTKGADQRTDFAQLSTTGTEVHSPSLAMNSLGNATVSWELGAPGATTIQAAVHIGLFSPAPPQGVKGKQANNQFVTQTLRVNVLKWYASPSPSVTQYLVLRNGTQIGSVPASANPSFQDPNPPAGQTLYEVIAVNAEGQQSTPVPVAVP